MLMATLCLPLTLRAAEPYAGIGTGAGFVAVTNLSSSDTTPYSSLASNLLVGFQFNDHLAVEAEYLTMGKFMDPSVSLDLTTLGISAVGILPLAGGKFSLLWKGGIATTTASQTPAPGYVLDGEAKTSKTGLSLGFAGQYNVSPGVGLRLSVNRYDYVAGTAAGRVATVNICGIFRF